MIRSMTGFGRARRLEDGREITVELKSVNHRYLDISFRTPRSLMFAEDMLRKKVSDNMARGHVDVNVLYRNTRADSKQIIVDDGLAEQYLVAARAVQNRLSIENDLTVSRVFKLADVVTVTEADDDKEAILSILNTATEAAIAELLTMRANEGERIEQDLMQKLEGIATLHAEIKAHAPSVVEGYVARLKERVAAMLEEQEVDNSRLATEFAIFADKAGIDEELVRISAHIEAFKDMLATNEPTGRKLDFLVQELNREFNTIGSKANDSKIGSLVISAKAELEKLREQVQNIE